MIIDCHVHVSALTAGHGSMSPRLIGSIPFRFMRWRLGLHGADAQTERDLEVRLAAIIAGTPELDAAAVLAFDAVYDLDGGVIDSRTHLYVTNEYVAELCSRNRQMLFGASVHPYRRDAAAELDRCIRGGAALLKWLPVVQGMDPSHPRCIPFYEALADARLPLLCHTGGEQSLPGRYPELADPMLLEGALKRGVTVIMAHCGTRSTPFDRDYLPSFMRLVRDYEHCYGDTSALNLPTRSYAYGNVLSDPLVREKLIHGSDWPIVPVPPMSMLGIEASFDLWRERNWMRRDVRIKKMLGFDDAYWRRAARVLRIDRRAPALVPATRPAGL